MRDRDYSGEQLRREYEAMQPKVKFIEGPELLTPNHGGDVDLAAGCFPEKRRISRR